MQVFVWNDNKDANQKVILFLHGGAYVLQPSMMHFNMVHKIAQAIDAKVVFPIYPKAPKHQYRETYEKLEKVYRGLLEEHTNPNSIIVMGDSAGGGLSLGFAIYLKDFRYHSQRRSFCFLLGSILQRIILKSPRMNHLTQSLNRVGFMKWQSCGQETT